ncbi:MAG TPA: transporter [Gemmatimonadales bacterium]
MPNCSFRLAVGSWCAVLATLAAGTARAQENYEIQVYGSETMAAGHTIFELHSNFTGTGSTLPTGTMLPTDHALHETLEITHGFNGWFELGWYIFTAVPNSGGWNWVGDHIRPRVRAPEAWHWPVGASLSIEAGYQRQEFSEDTWSVEIRPIIDKQMGRFYWSVNPTMGLSLKNPAGDHALTFEPNVAVGFDATEQVNLSLEYYGSLGPVTGFVPSNQQEHLIFPAVNLNVSPKWEINFGVGFGLTDAGDKGIVKLITGYRL